MPGGMSISQWSDSLQGPLGRRSGEPNIFEHKSGQEVQDRAMQLAVSLRRHELEKMNKKFNYFNRGNLLKFSLMVISLCSYLILLHADFHTEIYSAFVVQLGTSTPLIPSMLRVSSMSMHMNLASPIIDMLIVVIILIHQLMAAITLLLTFANTDHPNFKELLCFNAALLLAGASVCCGEIVLFAFSGQLQLQSLSSTPSQQRQDEAVDRLGSPILL